MYRERAAPPPDELGLQAFRASAHAGALSVQLGVPLVFVAAGALAGLAWAFGVVLLHVPAAVLTLWGMVAYAWRRRRASLSAKALAELLAGRRTIESARLRPSPIVRDDGTPVLWLDLEMASGTARLLVLGDEDLRRLRRLLLASAAYLGKPLKRREVEGMHIRAAGRRQLGVDLAWSLLALPVGVAGIVGLVTRGLGSGWGSVLPVALCIGAVCFAALYPLRPLRAHARRDRALRLAIEGRGPAIVAFEELEVGGTPSQYQRQAASTWSIRIRLADGRKWTLRGPTRDVNAVVIEAIQHVFPQAEDETPDVHPRYLAD